MKELTEREMLIAKISLMQGVVICTKVTPEEATEKLKGFCGKHGFTFVEALELEKEIDQMLGDDTLT